jgi:hypothetical protein
VGYPILFLLLVVCSKTSPYQSWHSTPTIPKQTSNKILKDAMVAGTSALPPLPTSLQKNEWSRTEKVQEAFLNGSAKNN